MKTRRLGTPTINDEDGHKTIPLGDRYGLSRLHKTVKKHEQLTVEQQQYDNQFPRSFP